ncbi:hypothetical protein HPB50_027991 [Hyalomma asiaticum]|nr:hypothetical protein HPB50_027991 [Hyalomma asiaticum]
MHAFYFSFGHIVAGPGDPFSCSFDKGGLCQWSTEGKPGVSTWAFGIPENSNIGPLSAPADGKGGTIYVNETILANGKHKQVKLSSRVVGKQKEAACFTFWYHMFAGHGTELALYQISARETDGKEDSRELFKHSGRTTVDRWQQVRLSVQLGRKRNQLRFSAALASKEHASVIALGPFDYTQGTCDVLTDANAQVLMAANKEGQSVIVAIVTSPKLQGKREPQCLEFWYTVMGPRGAELRAEIPVDNKTEVIWKKRPTSDWMLARVQLVKSKPFQVTFRAALPAKKRSVVSIDDVAVRPEPCLPSANCEFVEGICGYVNKFRQDVRWLVGAGRLEEPERQPSAFSSFAYLDLSSQDVSESDPVKTVGLLSPFFDIVDDQTMIVLQYFRHGPDIAEANMSVSCHSDDTTKKTQTLYSAELDEVTEWSELTVALKPGSNCQLAVWVTTGGSTNGAMAIHSVKVQQQAHCTFDEGTMCGWTSDGGAMTWTLNNPANKVPSYPRFDHTTLAYKGGFIFADNKKSSEKTAVLKSPTLNLNSVDGACFSFWHFAQHKFMGNITVHSGKQVLFTTSTRASHRWQHALAQFNGTADRLELEIRASIGRGLIALDDLRITDGPCPQSDFCSWQEESLCLVNQDPGNIVPWVRREASEVGVPDHTLNNLEGYYLYVNTTALDSHHPEVQSLLTKERANGSHLRHFLVERSRKS